jgi:hypothetical protein
VQRFDEVENVFHSEIYEKKKQTASLKAALKHKRLGKGSIKFASDLMSRKEKLQHRKAGKVMTTNMYDTILTIEEFNALETYEKKNRMQHWRLNNTIKEIQVAMGISNAVFYKLIDELELPKDRGTKKPRKPRTASKNKTVAVIAKKVETPAPALEMEATPPAPPVQEIIINGLNLTFNGTYEAELIQKQLLKILTLLDGETDQYYVEMKLMQKAAK